MDKKVCPRCGLEVEERNGCLFCSECNERYETSFFADGFETDISNFETSNGVLKKYIGNKLDVVIPKGITKIDDMAFFESFVNSVVIPDTVTEIGLCAFRKSSLRRVIIPDSVKKIGGSAFSECSVLKYVKLPNSIREIPHSCFHKCESLYQVELPNELSTIREDAFDSCYCLKKLDIPSTIKYIGQCAFRGCRSLEVVHLGNHLEYLGPRAFESCKSITNIEIPDSIYVVDEKTFYDCESLQKAKLPSSLICIGESAFQNCRKLERIVIPPSVISILGEAFSGCSQLKDIVLPHTPMVIRHSAFARCGFDSIDVCDSIELCSLASVFASTEGRINRIPSNGTETFALPDIQIPEAPLELFNINGGVLTKYSGQLQIVKIPSCVKEISANAFANNNCYFIIIPPSVKTIEGSFITNCSNLVYIKIPNTIENSIHASITSCNSLVEMRIEEGVECSIGIRDCIAIRSIVFPDSMKSIGSIASCEWLKSVTLPKNLKVIGRFLFDECERITEIKMPDSIEEIDSFNNYHLFEQINFSNLKIIRKYAFQKWRVPVIHIPSTIELVEESAFSHYSGDVVIHCKKPFFGLPASFHKNAFKGYGKKPIWTSEPMPVFESKRNTTSSELINLTKQEKKKTIDLLSYPESPIEDFVIRGGHLEKYIGNDEVIIIPSVVTHIDRYAFSREDKYINGLFIPSSVIEIDSSAFGGFSSMEKIAVDENNPYYDSRNDCCGIIRKKDDTLILACVNTVLDPTIKSIGDSAYARSKIKSIVLPNGITKIESSAFYHCVELEDIKFPSTLTSVDFMAFNYCVKLKNLVFPESVNKISGHVFDGSTNIKRIEFLSQTLSVGDNPFCGLNCELVFHVKKPLIGFPKSFSKIWNKNFYGKTKWK